MAKLVQRLSVLAVCLLGSMLVPILMAQVQPETPTLSPATTGYDLTPWPETLQVYPSHPSDPVKLVRITKDGQEVVPGTYRLPQITGDEFENVDVVKEWLKSASFTLKSHVSKNIVSVGISVVFPARRTGGDCDWLPRKRFGSTSWCDRHPRSCDGECPVLIHTTLYWGLIPALTASGLEARYQVLRSEGEDWRILRQGKAPLRLAPGGKVTLSTEGRTDKFFAQTVQRKPFHTQTLSLILREENIDEARDTAPCSDRYLDSKTGCAFAEVSKFNIGVDVVYFEDGTIWGNYGYGYALPNPDGIFTRVDARHFPGFANPASAPN